METEKITVEFIVTNISMNRSKREMNDREYAHTVVAEERDLNVPALAPNYTA